MIMDRFKLLLEDHYAFAQETYYNQMQASSLWKHSKRESPKELMYIYVHIICLCMYKCVCVSVCVYCNPVLPEAERSARAPLSWPTSGRPRSFEPGRSKWRGWEQVIWFSDELNVNTGRVEDVPKLFGQSIEMDGVVINRDAKSRRSRIGSKGQVGEY